MNTVTEYFKKFMQESKKFEAQDPVALEIDKIRKLINPEEGSEFAISVVCTGEVGQSVSPVTGAYSSRVITEDITGYLSIEKEDDGSWSWSTSAYGDLLDASDSGFGETLEECYDSLKNYADDLDDFVVDGLA